MLANFFQGRYKSFYRFLKVCKDCLLYTSNRLIHYEQAYDYENPFARSLIEKDPDTVDVVSRMYADVKDVVN